ncbi:MULTISPECIES: class F sortase [Streptomyces]|uniref:class F sortase n=1 Tax=Streptomyces TaxID=1883 RepID=UPI000B9EC74C|nr:class F sortase [Streptomyces kasugaensis]
MATQPPPQPDPSAPAPRSLGRALLWPIAAVGLGVFLLYNSMGTSAQTQPLPRPRAAVPAPAAPVAPDAPEAPDAPRPATSVAQALPPATPKRLTIPSIAVDAPFTALTLDAKGQLNAPAADNSNLVGWYQGGATPGESGTSIVAGHVDTKTGPAVFLQLSTLKAGNTVSVTRDDGTVATFKVDTVETFSKAEFPDERVYGEAATPQLRLITCGGAYNKTAKDYTDNVVVFAHLTSSKRA